MTGLLSPDGRTTLPVDDDAVAGADVCVVDRADPGIQLHGDAVGEDLGSDPLEIATVVILMDFRTILRMPKHHDGGEVLTPLSCGFDHGNDPLEDEGLSPPILVTRGGPAFLTNLPEVNMHTRSYSSRYGLPGTKRSHRFGRFRLVNLAQKHDSVNPLTPPKSPRKPPTLAKKP